MAVEALVGDAANLAGQSADVALQSHTWGDVDAITNVLLDNPYIFIGAAAGGAFGAAIGALPAFVFTGFIVLAGAAGAGPGVGIGFGPVFGPHISFAGGAAAAAYAGKAGKMKCGFDYHNGKDITFALGSRPDILAVGALFGMFGIAFEEILRQLAVPTDPIAITVVVSAFLHRAVFGYSILGKVHSSASGRFDMGPFERENMGNTARFGDGEKEPSDMLSVEPWLPEMYKWSHVASIGLVAGALSGYAGLQLAAGGLANFMVIPSGTNLANATVGTAVFFGFGLSAASLIFLNLGLDRIPVTHHMTLPGATAFFAVTQTAGNDAMLAGVDPIVGLIVAALFGMIGALIGEAGQRTFYSHGSTHVDPPAFAITVSITLIWVLVMAGVFETSVWVPGGP